MSKLLSIWGCFFGPLHSSFSSHPSLEPASASPHLTEPFPRPVAPRGAQTLGAFHSWGRFSNRGRWRCRLGCSICGCRPQSPFGVSNPRDKDGVPVPSHTGLPAPPPQPLTAHSLSVSPLGTWLSIILYSSLKSPDVHSLIIKEVP